jgi:hypothetical protein
MPFITSRRVRAILALLGTITACSGLEEACTQVGCVSGLTVNLSGVPIGAYSVEVIPEGPPGTMTYRVDCGGSAPSCGSQVYFHNVFVERAHVRVVSSLGTVTHAVGSITYRTTYPNGRQCEPACRQATVAVAIPE